jgi:hypothetical protein
MIRAFVSSTYVDLKAHRASVTGRLTAAGIFVDPMEKWTAASDAPKELSMSLLSVAASRQSAALIALVRVRRVHHSTMVQCQGSHLRVAHGIPRRAVEHQPKQIHIL